LLVYRSEDGQIKLEVHLENETVWLTQKMMAELFQAGANEPMKSSAATWKNVTLLLRAMEFQNLY
jgi:hypothetical protein